jgi:hypothetical protein
MANPLKALAGARAAHPLARELSTLEKLACEHAALASAVVADSYTRWLKGEQVALTEIATVQNAFLRVAGAIGFSRRAKDITPDINTYLEKEDR